VAIGIVLIIASMPKKRLVYDGLLRISAIKELNLLPGKYDLVARVEADSRERIGKIVVGQIRPLDGIIDTKTLTGLGVNFQ